MNKLLIVIISLLIVGCCKDTDLPDNGLNGNIVSLTEYDVLIKYDSINQSIRDTLSVVQRFYNEQNQIVERNEKFIFADETMDIKYDYNRCGRLEKERIKMSFDSNTVDVNYIYKASLLNKTISESSRDSISFQQIGLYHYNSDNKLITNTFTNLFIDLKTGDTIRNSLKIDNYSENGIVAESEVKNQINPSQNRRIEYIYKGKDLIKSLEYNQNDSLISTYHFEYEKDSLDNWIERKEFENSKLKSIKTWNIIYK